MKRFAPSVLILGVLTLAFLPGCKTMSSEDQKNLGDAFLAAIRGKAVAPGDTSKTFVLTSNVSVEGKSKKDFETNPGWESYQVKLFDHSKGAQTVSLETALRKAGVPPINLARASAISPPHARFVSKAAGLRLLKPGQILFVVLSENAPDEPRRLLSAPIRMGLADGA